jgi:transcriptional regulator of arginine metabolism
VTKGYRHGQILAVISRQQIHTQEELVSALGELGLTASQVTLSRDVHELGLVKTPQGYRQVEPARDGPGVETVAQEMLRDVRAAKNLLVLTTLAGTANAFAAALDRARWPEVVGTIAGDDTVLVVTPEDDVAIELRQKLLAMLGR